MDLNLYQHFYIYIYTLKKFIRHITRTAKLIKNGEILNSNLDAKTNTDMSFVNKSYAYKIWNNPFHICL